MRLLLLALAALLAIPAMAQAPERSWTRAQAGSLLDYGRNIGVHGLDPGDYALPALASALSGSDPAAVNAAATRSFSLIAADMANGRSPPGARRPPSFSGIGLTPKAAADLLDRALASGDVVGPLESLSPAAGEYRALQGVLRTLPPGEADHRRAILATLERWRWLPRDLGGRYILVNLPEYTAWLFEGGAATSTHRVIIGKRSTPTPQFAAAVTGVVINPVWQVPQSIIAESVGKLVRTRPDEARARGYDWEGSGASLRVSQGPGPQNSLGQVKLDMPNSHAVYMHDTPSKALFDRQARTFSHGCVRTEKPFDLAARLLAGTGWDAARINATVATLQTVRVELPRPVPVYLVYLTVRIGPDGAPVYLEDPYRLDKPFAAAAGAARVQLANLRSETDCSVLQ